jgi:peroxiredoxin
MMEGHTCIPERRAGPFIILRMDNAFERLLSDARTASGSLAELSHRAPVLVVFLRHLGCTFNRQTAADIRAQLEAIQATGTAVAFVHMGGVEEGDRFLANHGLPPIPHISDPQQELYRAFGLRRGRTWQVMGPRIWQRGWAAVRRHGLGWPRGDVRQMPGVFLVHRATVVREFRHQTSADRPDYLRLVTGVTQPVS